MHAEPIDTKLLTERKVWIDYGLSLYWLRRKRFERQGPPFLRIGKRMIRYRRADIEAYLERHRVRTES